MSGKIVIAARRDGNDLLGFVRVEGPKGSYVVRVKTDLRPIVKLVVALAHRKMSQMSVELGASHDRLYEVGFFKKLFRWVKKTVKKIANSKFIKGIVKAVKWIANTPMVKGLVGLASAIPFIGPVIKQSHKMISGVDKIVDKAKAGNVMAQKVIQGVAKSAADGNPTAVNIAKRMVGAAGGQEALAAVATKAIG